MHLKSDNIETMINDEVNEAIKELFVSLKNRYQNNFESMKDSELVFDYVHLLYYKCHKIIANPGGSINPISKKDDKYFQYIVTILLNHEEIGKHAEKITKIELFINKYKLEGINFPSEKDD